MRDEKTPVCFSPKQHTYTDLEHGTRCLCGETRVVRQPGYPEWIGIEPVEEQP